MIEVSNVRMSLDEGMSGNGDGLKAAAARALRLDAGSIEEATLLRRSVDARKKSDVHFVATLAVSLADASGDAEGLVIGGKVNASGAALEGEVLSEGYALARGVNVKPYKPYEPLEIPRCAAGGLRPVVVGTGPAGLFAALYLARAGLRPLVLERGGCVEERQAAVEAFNAGGALDLSTNIQFGEGGAGTFSDGKLNTGTKSPLAKHVLHWFVEAGAPEEILVEAAPHIGTDKLVDVVRAMRRAIEALGGEVRFHAQLTGFEVEGAALRAITVRDTSVDAQAAVETRIEADQLILACGHSARDTFQAALDAGLHLEQKPFSMGVRIEHRQSDINRAQYGEAAQHPALGAANYKLVAHLDGGRSVYTFCMCPGGEVVAAASEDGGVVVNGMSRFARDGQNANAALLVDVRPDDFGADDPLAGTRLQRKVEKRAFDLARKHGGAQFAAPAQTVGDFLAGRHGNPSKRVKPSYPRGVVWTDLRDCLPGFVADALSEGLPELDARLRGFADAQAVMTGVETRSSSPVRIVRGVDYQAVFEEAARVPAPTSLQGEAAGLDAADKCGLTGASGIFPAGEGPGYAGGIMSAAVDGLRAAHALVAAREQRAAQSTDAFASAQLDNAGPADEVAKPAGSQPAYNLATFEQTIDVLRAGKPAIFPTETVLGLGVAVTHAQTPEALFALKDRPASKPIAWLIGGVEDIARYGRDVPEYAFDLAKRNCPGPLTLIVNASAEVPAAYRSQAHTIGLRIPDCAQTLALIAAAGPLATTSANPSNSPAPQSLAALDADFARRVECVFAPEGAPSASGVASTIIDCTGEKPRIVRQGTFELKG